jgi:hypothetical protein
MTPAHYVQEKDCAPSPLAGERGTLNCAPSADAVAGNGWDGGDARQVGSTGSHPHPSPGATVSAQGR